MNQNKISDLYHRIVSLTFGLPGSSKIINAAADLRDYAEEIQRKLDAAEMIAKNEYKNWIREYENAHPEIKPFTKTELDKEAEEQFNKCMNDALTLGVAYLESPHIRA